MRIIAVFLPAVMLANTNFGGAVPACRQASVRLAPPAAYYKEAIPAASRWFNFLKLYKSNTNQGTKGSEPRGQTPKNRPKIIFPRVSILLPPSFIPRFGHRRRHETWQKSEIQQKRYAR
jgi:hypothetical protein